MTHSTLSLPSAASLQKPSPSAPAVTAIPKKQKRIWALPGLTGPVILVAPPAQAVRKNTLSGDILSLAAEVFELRAWREMDPIGCFMLAGFAAAIAQPLVFGSLGNSIVALMTPLK